MLFHGFTSAGSQWIGHGHAAAIAAHGYRVILPDPRGHGDSARPHDPACYPPDVLAGDGLALVDRLGLDAIDGATNRTGRHRRVLTVLAGGDTIEPGSPDEEMAYWINQPGTDPQALLHVLDTHVATSDAALRQVATPTLVVIGDQDDDHASADVLAAALPNARFARVPDNHFTALDRSS